MSRLSEEQKEFIKMELDLGLSNVELAKRFGVSEGTIRYHRKKARTKKADGRKTRYSAVSAFQTPIEAWIQENQSTERSKRDSIWSLYTTLEEFHKYELSYDALRRYLKKRHPELVEKSYHLRVETPPGKLSQVDWKEDVKVQLREPGNWITVNVLIVLLCFSRKPALVVRAGKDQQSFLSAHCEALKKLEGVTEYVRSDCMATAVKLWHGRYSEMTAAYDEFLRGLKMKGFPARPATATDKGKVEKKIGDIFRRIDFRRLVFRDLEHLQRHIDGVVDRLCAAAICPATGTSVEKAYAYERKELKPLPVSMPEIPVETAVSTVRKDSLVWFRGNFYQIPEGYTGKTVRCVNTGRRIDIYFQGELLESHAYHPDVKGMTRISPRAIEKTTRPVSDLVKEWTLEVASRQLDYYEAITGGAR
jgi:transposase